MKWLITPAAIAVLLLAAGCGDDDDDSDQEDAEEVCTPGEGDDDGESVCGPAAGEDTGDGGEVVDPAGGDEISLDDIPHEGVTLGEEAAPVRFDIYMNFLCPHCAEFSLESFPGLAEDYVAPGDVFLVFHHAPLGGPEASTVHIAAQCAAEQDLFWPYQQLLFENQSSLQSGDPEALKVLAGDVGVDQAAFDQCLDGQETIVAIEQDRDAFLGFPEDQQGLPLALVADEVLTAPTEEQVRSAIDAAIAE